MRRPRQTPAPPADDAQALVSFYDEAYTRDAAEAERYSRWRALGALGKADHVTALCARAGIVPAATLEVGCGDGALLCELHSRGFGGRLAGVEITEASVALYDGSRLDQPDGGYDLGILSHVLEHVPDPAALLGEVARVCGAVVLEVPLEANLSAARTSKREHAGEVGHLQRLDRRTMRDLVGRAGLRVAHELEDPLPLSVHRFFASTRAARIQATAKWALRAGTHSIAPGLSRRLFTVHYACLCLPRTRS